MSSPVRPDAKAFRELEVLVRNLGEELAIFRKRALTAEARLKAIASGGGSTADERAEERVAQHEAENATLTKRIESASARMHSVLDRVRFLRQQHAGDPR